MIFRESLFETPPTLAKAVGVSVETIRAAIHSGELEAIRFGKGAKATFRISREAWETFLKRRSTKAVTPPKAIKPPLSPKRYV